MEAAARKGVFVCSTIKGLLPALRKAMPSVSFVEIPSDDLRKGSKATEQWNREAWTQNKNTSASGILKKKTGPIYTPKMFYSELRPVSRRFCGKFVRRCGSVT